MPDIERCIRAENVSFSYDGMPILASMSLEVAQGELCCLVGVNGCGKSTFLDCILGINTPATGTVTIDGYSIAGMNATERARRLAYVPQVHDRTFPYRVKDIVLMGRTAYQTGLGSPDEEDRSIVERALATCGIDKLAERPYTQLSGGEMQMVILARALVQQTPYLLMDEPTAHLDFRNEMLFMETVTRLAREGGVGILMATHSPNQAFYLQESGLPTKVAMMLDGTIALEGTPDETLTPDNLRRVYGIEVCLMEDHLDDGRAIRRVAPLSTTAPRTDGAHSRSGDTACGDYASSEQDTR